MELHEDVFVICPERIPRHDALSFWRGEGIRGKYDEGSVSNHFVASAIEPLADVDIRNPLMHDAVYHKACNDCGDHKDRNSKEVTHDCKIHRVAKQHEPDGPDHCG